VRLNDALHLIGMMLGGQAGVKLAMGLGMRISPDTPAAVKVADRFHLLQNLAETRLPSVRRTRVLP
jgi:hypothetical protein